MPPEMVVKKVKKSSRAKKLSKKGQPRPLSGFARSLRREWKHLGLPTENVRVVIGVSGGADSTALLLAIEELIAAKKLKITVHVVHIDHRLRGGASTADARWVRELSKQLGFDVSIIRIEVKDRAQKTRDNLEQAARRARYQAFARQAQKHRAAIVLTAHSVDDQAETFLLNLLRGSGAAGLRGIEPVRPITEQSGILLARPFVSRMRRDDTESYCALRGVDFRHDEMNADENFARVRARRQLLPLMETFNPRVVETLTRTATLLRDDNAALESAAGRLLELSLSGTRKKRELSVDLLGAARPALRRRALRQWLAQQRGDLRRLELVHISAVENLLTGNQGGRKVELPGGSIVTRVRGNLIFKANSKTPVRRKTY